MEASRRKSRDFAPVYALGWLSIIAAAYALSPLWVGGVWVLVPVLVVAAWRYLDIVLWYLGLLLNARHTRFAPVERNVLLLMVDLITVVFIAAILLRATDTSRSFDTAWFDGFFLVTLTDVPARLDVGDGLAQVAALSQVFSSSPGG